MQKRNKLAWIILLATSLFMMTRMVETSLASASAVHDVQGKQLLNSNQVNLLLLLMDTDRNGKISKQEWMSFAGKTFERLDQDKKGEIGPKELSQLRIGVSSFANSGK